MARSFRISHQARRDVQNVLAWTLEQFGERQHEHYQGLIKQSIADVVADPEHPNTRKRPEIHEQARTFHIARHGHKARHFWLFRVTDDGVVEFARLLHDGMELSTHLPAPYRPDDE